MHREINGGGFLAVESIHGLVLGFHAPLNLFADVVLPRRKYTERACRRLK